MSERKYLKQECPSCGGTGVYCGFAEPKGEAVVCLSCDGKGWNMHTYFEFTKRKLRKGINFVSQSPSRNLITGVGPRGEKMTYEEWLERSD